MHHRAIQFYWIDVKGKILNNIHKIIFHIVAIYDIKFYYHQNRNDIFWCTNLLYYNYGFH